MPDINVFDPTNLQRLLFQAMVCGQFHTIIAYGSIRGGKTVGMALAGVSLALYNEQNGLGNGQYLIGGRSLGHILVTQRTYWKDVCESLGVDFKEVGGNYPHFRIGSSYFYLKGGADADSFKEINGWTLTAAFLDEATLLNETFVKTAQQRLSFGHSLLMMVSNTDSPFHWLRQKYILMPSFASITLDPTTPQDGPSKLAEARKTGLHALGIETNFYDNHHYDDSRRQQLLEEDGDWFARRMIHSEWNTPTGLVYTIDQAHLTDREDLGIVGTVSFDLGLAGTTAALLWVRDGKGNRVVADEYYHVADIEGVLSDDQHLDRLQARWKFNTIVGDPSAVSTRQAALKRGILWLNADNEINAGVAHHVNSLLRQGKVAIHEKCVKLLTEAASYHWNEKTEKPEKQFDHACDCLRYGAQHFFPAASYAIIG